MKLPSNDFIKYKDNEQALKEINPFMRWKLLDAKTLHSQESRIFAYRMIHQAIPFEQMNFGESIFLPIPPKIWNKIKHLARRDPSIKVKYIDTMKDSLWGLRAWSLITTPSKMMRPLRIIYPEAA